MYTAAANVEPYEDWLHVTAYCGADGASGWANREFLPRWEADLLVCYDGSGADLRADQHAVGTLVFYSIFPPWSSPLLTAVRLRRFLEM